MKFLFIICFAFAVVSCKNDSAKNDATASGATAESKEFSSVVFTDSVQNIGELKEGVKAEIKFHFKNTGDQPLFIMSAEPGCGCTVADFPREAIAPGTEEEIVASFDTKGRSGNFSKVITVITNTQPNTHTLTFMGDIKPKEGEQPADANTEKKTN